MIDHNHPPKTGVNQSCAPKGAGESPWLEIQPLGSRPPLVLIHGVGGGMLWGYANLARHLGEDQPVYALKARPHLPATIDAMADHYVRELREFIPEGPYLLGGYCFGGNIAYEMACRLDAGGSRVGLVALMNASPPNSSYDEMNWTPAFACKFALNLANWAAGFTRWPADKRARFIRWKLQMTKKRLARLARRRTARPGIDANEKVDLDSVPQGDRELWERHVISNLRHRSGPYRGRVVLLRTRGHPVDCNYDHACGWRDLVGGGVDVRIIPGLHESLLEEPHVHRVARELKASIDTLCAGEPGKS
jgi:thioesterase domain-containing protein